MYSGEDFENRKMLIIEKKKARSKKRNKSPITALHGLLLNLHIIDQIINNCSKYKGKKKKKMPVTQIYVQKKYICIANAKSYFLSLSHFAQ